MTTFLERAGRADTETRSFIAWPRISLPGKRTTRHSTRRPKGLSKRFELTKEQDCRSRNRSYDSKGSAKREDHHSAFLDRLAARSLASLSAVRFFAAAMAAFLARADRSSGVIVSKLRLPPILPPFAPISRMISRKMAFVLRSIQTA